MNLKNFWDKIKESITLFSNKMISKIKLFFSLVFSEKFKSKIIHHFLPASKFIHHLANTCGDFLYLLFINTGKKIISVSIKVSELLHPIANKAGDFIYNNSLKAGSYINNFFVSVFSFSSKIYYKLKFFLQTFSYAQRIVKLLTILLRFLAGLLSPAKKIFIKTESLAVRKPFAYYSLILLTNIILIFLIVYQVLFAKHTWEGNAEKKFYIRKGQNLEEIADDLKAQNIIKSKILFKGIVKLRASEEKIYTGNYIFKSGVCNLEVLAILTDKPPVVKFTIPEGWTLKQISKLAESKLNLSGELFLKETENDSLINLFGLKGRVKNLEGFLYPDTYFLSNNIDEKSLVILLVNEFLRKTKKDANFSKILASKNLILADVVILASIVQAETSINDEMPLIAGVYYNRLKINMNLQADPTIQYVLPGGPKRLKKEDLQFKSPYNTYLYVGLPPGPINNPGFTALTAALNPKESKYLYFVATGKGGHKFSETLQEHDKAVKEYRKNR